MLFSTLTFASSPVRVVLSPVISSSVRGFGSLRLPSFLPTRKTRLALLSQRRHARSKVLFAHAGFTVHFLRRRRARFISTYFPERIGCCLCIRVLTRKILRYPDRAFSTGHDSPFAVLPRLI